MAEKKGFGKSSLLSWVAAKGKKSGDKKMDDKSWKSKGVKAVKKAKDTDDKKFGKD